ncbi:cytochrome P450 [Flagelloscypha sp. PMI_526]|nr:cytochrome P450 [Flagelloscypha sp. PMI_526]
MELVASYTNITAIYWTYIAGSLVAHFVFNRYEPQGLVTRVGLLLGIPILNSFHTHGFDPFALLAAIGFHNAGLLGSLFLYRCNPRHPLAAYPGPFLASLTNLWMAYKVSGGKRHIVLRALHERYGTHVRIGPNTLSIADADVVTTLLHDPKVPRSSAYRAVEPDHIPGNILSSRSIRYPNHLKVHAEQRERWSKGFTAAALEEFNAPLTARLIQLLEKLRGFAKTHSEVDLDEWFKIFVWDFMGDLVFGGGFSMMEDGGDENGYRSILEQALVAQTPILYMAWINNILPHLAALGLIKDSQSKILQFAESCMIKRGRQPLAFRDLVYFFAKEDEQEHLRPTRGAIINDAFIGIVGGSDTTVLTISALFFLLLSHPEKLEELKKEIDTLDEGELSNFSRLAQLPYLNACIDETLRLFPPLPCYMSRAPPSGSGKVVAGRFVPDGTTVIIPTILLGRDPRYFYPEPTSFWPERWLTTERTANPEIVHNIQAFVPFSAGVTLCLGKQLAYRELRLTTTNLIRNFNMKLVLKEGTVQPPGIEEMLFEKPLDWGTFSIEKGFTKVTLESRI